MGLSSGEPMQDTMMGVYENVITKPIFYTKA